MLGLPLVVSPAADHTICAAYADYLHAQKGFDWSYTYGGARWELGSSRLYGVNVWRAATAHLVRVKNPTADDWIFDFVAGRRKVDCKAAEPLASGYPPSLIVPEPHAGIDYLLGNCTTAFPGKNDSARDLTFKIGGWRSGDDPIWKPCPFNGPTKDKPWVPAADLLPFIDHVGLV